VRVCRLPLSCHTGRRRPGCLDVRDPDVQDQRRDQAKERGRKRGHDVDEARGGQRLIEEWIEIALDHGWPLPQPQRVLAESA